MGDGLRIVAVFLEKLDEVRHPNPVMTARGFKRGQFPAVNPVVYRPSRNSAYLRNPARINEGFSRILRL